MCGIFLCLSENEELAEHYLQVLEPLLKNRGPDHVNKIRLELELSCDKKIYVTFLGCVLWLQGSQLTTQPVTDSDENILLWNGDIFGGQVEDGLSDTIVLSRRLQSLSDDEVPKEMSELQGPFAFAYLRGKTGKIWFGRDFFGRHSLLMETGLDRLVLSSIGHKAFKSLVEVPAAGIFVSEISRCFDAGFRVHPWAERSFDLDANFEVLEPIASSVRKMKCFEEITDEPQDLNESHGSSVNDKTTSHLSELERLFNSDASYQRLINDLLLVMMSSVQKRLSSMPKFCKNCVKTETVCSHSKIGVLFSGGLDSSVLAVLADQLLDQGESIDLLNVAFEQPNGSYNVPDRQTAIKAVKELAIINPQRKYNLVLINVSKDELAVNREQKIVHLLFPLTTVLDDSIGCAIWFAARGQGQIMDETGSAFVETYQSPVRVLLLGAGADEQFGGYSRHRVRFQQSGLSGLHDEIRLEMNRISERNLGRDNRIVSDHGVEGRYPFLDESVVSYLNSLKVNEKCDLRLPRGLGEKLLLRLLAFKLGLRQVAVEPKRAIQFGSRIARMENRKEKATDQALRSS